VWSRDAIITTLLQRLERSKTYTVWS